MSHLPEEDVEFVVSGVENMGNLSSVDHCLKKVILPAAKNVSQDLWIVSPIIVPELIFPVDVESERPSKRELNSYFDHEYRERLRSRFSLLTKGGYSRINLITNSITYDEDDFYLDERRMFAKILLDVFGDDLKMTSVYELSEENRPPTSSGIHAKAVIAGRRAAYLGSANFTRAGFVNNIEFGAVFKGYHEMAGTMLEACRDLVSSELFDVVHLDEDGEFSNTPPWW